MHINPDHCCILESNWSDGDSFSITALLKHFWTCSCRTIINFKPDSYQTVIIFSTEQHTMSCLSPSVVLSSCVFCRSPERLWCHFTFASGHYRLIKGRLSCQLKSVSLVNAISAWSCPRCGRKHRAFTHVNIMSTAS